MWDCLHHEQMDLTGRIDDDQASFLEEYIKRAPLSKDEEKEKEALDKWKDKVDLNKDIDNDSDNSSSDNSSDNSS